MGWSASASSTKGPRGFSPYTLEEEANSTRPTPRADASFSTTAVPVTLTSAYSSGASRLGLTPARAAR